MCDCLCECCSLQVYVFVLVYQTIHAGLFLTWFLSIWFCFYTTWKFAPLFKFTRECTV